MGTGGLALNNSTLSIDSSVGSTSYTSGVTASGSAVVGFISHRLGWWRRFGSVGQTLTIGYIVAAGLTLLNVLLTGIAQFAHPPS